MSTIGRIDAISFFGQIWGHVSGQRNVRGDSFKVGDMVLETLLGAKTDLVSTINFLFWTHFAIDFTTSSATDLT